MLRPPHSSRQRYLKFVEQYKQRRLDDREEADDDKQPADGLAPAKQSSSALETLGLRRGKRREYLREYLRWLWPHRYSVAALFAFALIAAGLEMIEPLFMRFIIDRVLLSSALEATTRLTYLHVAGALFLSVIVLSQMVGVLKDYRQRLLNVRVMLSLRRSLFERLLHLPLSRLWEMKTGGILSRLTGDVDTTTGLLQMAIVSPSISLIRLAIAVAVLFSLNWRLAFMALAIIPGAMLMSFSFARRIRPIYRVVLRPPRRAPQRAIRAPPRACPLDLLGSVGVGRQRGDRVVRRLLESGRSRLDRRHHGISVVHVSVAESRLEHREFVLGTSAVARRDGACL